MDGVADPEYAASAASWGSRIDKGCTTNPWDAKGPASNSAGPFLHQVLPIACVLRTGPRIGGQRRMSLFATGD